MYFVPLLDVHNFKNRSGIGSHCVTKNRLLILSLLHTYKTLESHTALLQSVSAARGEEVKCALTYMHGTSPAAQP